MLIISYSVSESKINTKPSLRDIRDTKKVLKDFEIVTDIPKFETYTELQKWQKQLIKAKLCG
jgi:hypothetical protein